MHDSASRRTAQLPSLQEEGGRWKMQTMHRSATKVAAATTTDLRKVSRSGCFGLMIRLHFSPGTAWMDQLHTVLIIKEANE